MHQLIRLCALSAILALGLSACSTTRDQQLKIAHETYQAAGEQIIAAHQMGLIENDSETEDLVKKISDRVSTALVVATDALRDNEFDSFDSIMLGIRSMLSELYLAAYGVPMVEDINANGGDP